MIRHVIKTDLRLEDFTSDKLMQVCEWSCEGLSGVSASELAMDTYHKLYDKITTRNLHETVIQTAVNKITEKTPNYDIVAARLVIFRIRKDAYGRYDPPRLFDIVTKSVKNGFYTSELLTWYSEKEFDEMDKFIKHQRDNNLTYAAVEQIRSKYLVQDRSKKEINESPQVMYALIAATLFHNEPKDVRMRYIKEYYEEQSTAMFSIPTPIAAGVRTPIKQFSSCCLIPVDDSLDSICEAGSAIVRYVSKKAGIGIDLGRIRAVGSKVGDGSVTHTGVLPFIKKFKGDLRSCSQGGVRSGSATVFYPWWHYEYPELIVLKNNRGTDESRERHVDYGVQLNNLLVERFLQDEDVTLFSPHEVPEVVDAFYQGGFDAFKVAYENAEKNPFIRKRVVKAKEIIYSLVTERQGTGRIYVVFQDNMISQSPMTKFKKNQWLSSNLCCEIALPLTSFTSFDDPDGHIALCTLSSTNWGKINSPSDLEKPCRSIVRALDNLLSYQDYPVKPAENFTKMFRALGVGIVGFAHFLAKRGLKYDIMAADIVDEYAEAMAYYLTDESCRLAEARGKCLGFDQTCYAEGLFPWERRNKNIDRVVKHQLRYPWEELRLRIKEFGIRNAFLSACAPTETSSILLGETNGIEPPIKDISKKKSKDGILTQLVPEFSKLRHKYDYKWDQPDNKGYLILMAVLQKWMCQSISSNTNYNPERFADKKVPVSLLIQDILFANEIGVKTLYYQNMNDMIGDDDGVKEVEEVCESCVI
jgi:ribonucleoside-diphosphate reductase alpha chain